MAENPDRRTPTALKPAQTAPELALADMRGRLPLSADELGKIAAAHDGTEEVLGQQRALDAIALAIGIDAAGYNVYVSGLRSRLEREAILSLLRQRAAELPTPGDWVYVNNFRSPEAPRALALKAGEGSELREQVSDLVKFTIDQLPKAFRREDFDQERTALRDKYNKRAQELFGNLESRARERGFAVQNAPTGQILFIPLINGQVPASPEELNKHMQAVPEAERERLSKAQAELQDEFGNLILKQQEMMRELVEDIRGVERAFAARLITPLAAAIKARFDHPGVTDYLDQLVEHMLSHLDRFREAVPQPGAPPKEADDEVRLVEYEVNVVVDNRGRSGAPVINEDAPTYRNLFGTIERWVDPRGRSGTNFTRIIPGSFMKSHGGFLVFDLEDAAIEPGVWKTLKRSLKSGRMTLETFEPFPFFMGSGLKPEPLEIKNKLVVLGGPYLYNLLYFYDSEFAELFKVKAETRPVVAADEKAVRSYARRVATVAQREQLPRFDGGALERIVEYGMRAAGDRTRLLSKLEPIDDLAREAAYFARGERAAEVSAAHVERALRERILRLNFIEEEIRRLIANGTLIVHLTGSAVGQINGLAVLDVGGYAFGRPSRVSATVGLGQAGVINIEREARLSGSTHDKGIMILSGFLRSRFGQRHPIAISASIGFEQSYSGIDGDSASSTELYALLSALSGAPLRQDLAVTGSVDQYGTVQAIGGVNEKIEGFYRVCKAVGLNGTQGVLIPRTNLNGMMLEPEITSAIESGRFHIYLIDTIDQGLELLTGARAGTIDEPSTVNYLVAQRLKEMAEALRERPSSETRIVREPAEPPAQPKPPAPPQPPR